MNLLIYFFIFLLKIFTPRQPTIYTKQGLGIRKLVGKKSDPFRFLGVLQQIPKEKMEKKHAGQNPTCHYISTCSLGNKNVNFLQNCDEKS